MIIICEKAQARVGKKVEEKEEGGMRGEVKQVYESFFIWRKFSCEPSNEHVDILDGR